MTNSVDPVKTIGEVFSGSTLFASILKLVSYVGLFAADDFDFQMHILSAL